MAPDLRGNASPRRAESWPDVHRRLSAPDRAALSPDELEHLADAAWWLCRVDESVEVRQQAYAAHDAAGDHRRAAYNAWLLFTEYRMTGRPTVAHGWLRKAQRQIRGETPCEELGYVTYGSGEAAEAAGEVAEALALAEEVVDIGRRCSSRELVTMGQELQGRILVSMGRVQEGMGLLDEAMSEVLTGELNDLVTGWVYCVAVAVCFDLADLPRAAEWNDAALEWCATLPAGTPYHGLCRVHRAELLGLAGSWTDADREADRACEELLAYHPSFAAEGYYVAGEVRRRRGDLAAAEQAFRMAHEHGREPQPGLALVRKAQGRLDDAAASLRSCLESGDWNLLTLARLLAAQAEVALARGDLPTARAAADALGDQGTVEAPVLLQAMAAEARGAVALADGDAAGLEHLRRARTLWLELGLPYEAARVRVRMAVDRLADGDVDTAHLELEAARSVFERLGSDDDVRRVDDLLGREPGFPAGLTRREVEVLRLVAGGGTNRDIAAELVISEHTVARHLNNIFTKLGVSSRAAATAFAYEHALVEVDRSS